MHEDEKRENMSLNYLRQLALGVTCQRLSNY